MNDRLLCGWRVRSDLALPELLPWTGDDRAPDIHIRLAEVPAGLAEPVFSGPLLQIAADGTCRFALPRVASYLLRGGGEVLVQPADAAAESAVRTFLFGTVFGLLVFQRGMLPLHASCVRIGGVAVAFAGHSGVGKSTLAAAFLQRGYDVLADDITVVDVDQPDGPVVLPAFPRLKLWRDAMVALDIATEGVETVRPELSKFALPIEGRFHAAPLPLAAVYHLETVRDPRHGEWRRLRGAVAVNSLYANVYRGLNLVRLGDPSATVATAMRLAATLRSNFRLARCHDHADMDAVIAEILARQEAS